MAVGVKVRNGNLEGALTLFKNRVMHAGILYKYKEKMNRGTSPSVLKKEKRKKHAAAKRS